MPNTIAENLQRLVDAKTAISSAITSKGGTVGANDGLEDFPTDIDSIPVGIIPAESKDVNFYDYDGTILYSYTAAEFANLTSLPPNPSHTGLTAHGWNWTLSDAKAYVANYGMLDIGQIYKAERSKAEIYITLTEGRLEPYLMLWIEAGTDLFVDWGDNSETWHYTGAGGEKVTIGHTYTNPGNYVISFHIMNLTGGFVGITGSDTKGLLSGNSENAQINAGYMSAIKKIIIGDKVDFLTSALDNARSLSIASRADDTNINNVPESCFNGCFSLPFYTNQQTSLSHSQSVGSNAFYKCYRLKNVSLNSNISNIGDNAFDSCTSLSRIAIPNTVTSIGASAFNKCYSLHDIVIPNSVTSIGVSAFNNCRSLSSIHIPSSVTSIGSNAFSNCGFLSTIYIDKPTGSISGAPWGASNDTQIIWNDN